MGRIISFRDLIGIIKDKASLSKATLLSNPSAASVRLAVLRATAHSPPSAPDDRHVSALLLSGEAPRSAASPVIAALMDRLHRTGSAVVALKCLLLIHHIIRRGPFILQDQLSIFPATGGRNYLNLSAFRDGATAATWSLSRWVRWYSRYLESLLSASRTLGYFLCSATCTAAAVKENQERRISSLLNSDLIKELDSLVGVIEEICRAPDTPTPEGEKITKEIIVMFLNDYLSSVNEILPRLGELNERLGELSFGDSVEIVCALKRLQDSRERLSILYAVNKPSIEMMWGFVQELRDKIGMLNREGGKFLTWRNRDVGSESARFDDRVVVKGNSVQFQSGRFSINTYLAFDKSF